MITGVTPTHYTIENRYLYDRDLIHAQSVFGIKYLRLINVQNSVEHVNGEWIQDSRLTGALNDCRTYGFSPHIVIFDNPGWYRTDLIESYVWHLLDYVHNKQGIQHARYGVGNEMLGYHASHSWLVPRELQPRFFPNITGDDLDLLQSEPEYKLIRAHELPGGKFDAYFEAMLPGPAFSVAKSDAYLSLYVKIARAFEAFERNNPAFSIELFGWETGFSDRVKRLIGWAESVKCDGIAIHHYYANEAPRNAQASIKNIKSWTDLPVVITEYGYSAKPDDYADMNYNELKGHTKMLIDLGVNEIQPLKMRGEGPALWRGLEKGLSDFGMALLSALSR